MTGQPAYDAIAKHYRESKWLLFRHFIERYTLFEVLGDLRGRTVLDLACGEGVYTRQFKRAGAGAVTGVDISQAMIALAEGEERQDPLGCRYVRADAAAFTPAAPVDIVTAVYLLNYARTPETLDRFCCACFRALRPGGRLVGFNDNVRHPPPPGVSLAKYGFERTCASPLHEGDVIQYRITNHDGQVFAFENYYLAPGTHTPPDVAFATRQLTPIRRPGRRETNRPRHGPVAGHISGTYPRMPAYQDVGGATPGRGLAGCARPLMLPKMRSWPMR